MGSFFHGNGSGEAEKQTSRESWIPFFFNKKGGKWEEEEKKTLTIEINRGGI